MCMSGNRVTLEREREGDSGFGQAEKDTGGKRNGVIFK